MPYGPSDSHEPLGCALRGRPLLPHPAQEDQFIFAGPQGQLMYGADHGRRTHLVDSAADQQQQDHQRRDHQD